jgi:hypothetical protein
MSAAQCLELLQSLAQETERFITSNRVTAGEARVWIGTEYGDAERS